jgi:hypothetical protein
VNRTRWIASAIVACTLATIAVAQTPAPSSKSIQRKGGPVVVSPIAPQLAAQPTPLLVTGRIGTAAADRLSLAAATSASLVPSAPRYVPVTVVNRTGGRAGSLSLTDFGIIEDGVRQRAVSIERWPLWLVIVLDCGRQIGPVKQLAVHRQLVYDLLYALGEDDHVSLVQYSDGVECIQPWTRDVREAEEAVESRFESGLDGQLWDSVAYAAENLLADKLGHKVVVVVTDGIDDAGRESTYTRAHDLLRDSAATLYIVNLSRYLEEKIRREAYGVNGVLNVITSPSYVGRRKELRQYAERLGEAPPKMVEATTESGGKLWLVSPDEDPARLPGLVWQQIEGQYMVSYVPERDGDARSTRPFRALSAFVPRGDIEALTPAKLFTPIVAPRSSRAGTTLRKSGK